MKFPGSLRANNPYGQEDGIILSKPIRLFARLYQDLSSFVDGKRMFCSPTLMTLSIEEISVLQQLLLCIMRVKGSGVRAMGQIDLQPIEGALSSLLLCR